MLQGKTFVYALCNMILLLSCWISIRNTSKLELPTPTVILTYNEFRVMHPCDKGY